MSRQFVLSVAGSLTLALTAGAAAPSTAAPTGTAAALTDVTAAQAALGGTTVVHHHHHKHHHKPSVAADVRAAEKDLQKASNKLQAAQNATK